MDSSRLLSLLHLADLTLPVGGYAHSFGMETYVQQGIVRDLSSAKEFIESMLQYNLRYTDASFASLAYDAAEERNQLKLTALNDECNAVKIPAEIRQASLKMGSGLIKIFQDSGFASFPGSFQHEMQMRIRTFHYSVIFGLFASGLRIPKEAALTGFYYNAAAGMVTNAVKLVPLGQQQGQQLLFSLHPLMASLANLSISPDASMIGMSCSGFDVRCMQHEHLYSRLYMS